MINTEKQQAIDIINDFIWWFVDHKLPIEDELMERVDKFINGGCYEN